MQNYRIPLSEISPSGKDMTLDDPAIWQGPLAEFRMDCRIIDPLKAELGIMPLEGGYLVRGSITGTVVLPCNRCAEDVTVTVDSHFENFEETAAEPEDEEAAVKTCWKVASSWRMACRISIWAPSAGKNSSWPCRSIPCAALTAKACAPSAAPTSMTAPASAPRKRATRAWPSCAG